MCCRNRAVRRAARRGCGHRGWNNGVRQPHQSLIRKIVNHIIEHREQKLALAPGQYGQPRALEEWKQELGVDENLARELARVEWVDEKEKLKAEDLARTKGVGMVVDEVGRENAGLPGYWEDLKN